MERADRPVRSRGHALKLAIFAGRAAAFLVLCATFAVHPFAGLQGGRAQAEDRYLDVRRGEFKPVAIAVTPFAGDGGAGAQTTAIIMNNFKRSVFLAPLD